MPKLLVGRTTLNGEKKRMHGLNVMWVNTRRMGGGGGGRERRGLGPRNDVLTTYKAVTLRDGQRIIAAFFSQ